MESQKFDAEVLISFFLLHLYKARAQVGVWAFVVRESAT